MLKHFKSTLASLLAAALLVTALAVPTLAADKTIPKDRSFNHDIDQVQDVQVINRELHASYAVTNPNDRTAVISALNALTVAPMKAERGEEDGLRLLTVLMENGDRYNYWCYKDGVLQSDGWQAGGKQLGALYDAMTRCQQNYPANIEWLGYMNPYRVTKVELSGAVLAGDVFTEGNASFDSSVSQEQRDKILDLCARLKNVKVGTVQRFNGDEMEKVRSYNNYQISMSFEEDREDHYTLQIPNRFLDEKGEIWISVDSIGYDLCYTASDAALLKELTDTLDTLLQ